MQKFLSAFITGFLLLFFCTNEVAGQAAISATDTSARPRTFAMIMGISTYKYIRPLSYADSDAELFRDFLKSGSGGRLPDTSIYFQKNETATQANFLVKGMAWIKNKGLRKGDRLYIYLAGHGDAIDELQYFFLAYDCNPAGDKNNYNITGTVPLYPIKANIVKWRRLGVDVVFIMDACRSNEKSGGGGGKDDLPGGGEGRDFLTQGITETNAGEIIMLATGQGEESLEDAAIGTGHGLFTYYLVEGLIGMADAPGNKDGTVSLSEIKKYIGSTVPTIAMDKYKKKQDPYVCCEVNDEKIISMVDTAFMRKWIMVKQLRGQLEGKGSEFDLIAKNFKTRGGIEKGDTAILDLYNNFNKALKDYNLSGNEKSAESIYQKLNELAPGSSYTLDAKLSLATEFINFAQSKINLYLEGRDVTTIQRIRSQLDADDKSDEVSNSLDRMEKIARQESSEVGKMLERAIVYAEVDDENFKRSLTAKNFFFKANGYFEKGKNSDVALKQAISDAMIAYKEDPKAAYILNTLSSLEIDNNKLDSAIYFGKKAFAIAPHWRYPYVNVANAFTKKNNPDSALVYFRKALEVDAERADAYVDLGYFYFQQRKFDSAKVYYQKALVLDPLNVPANNNMGWLLRELRQFDESISFFRKTLEYDPKFFNAYNGISRVFTDMGKFDSARVYYQKASLNYPDKLITSNYLGQFYQEINQVDSARSYFIQAAVYDPSYDAPLINLGKLYAQTKQFDSASLYYRKAIELNGKNFRGFNELGKMFSDMKNLDSASFYYRKGLEINPDNTIVLNNFGLSFYNNDKLDSASKYFLRVLEVQPENPYAVNNLGLVFYKMKKLDSAKVYYIKALSLKPDLPSALYNMGLTLSAQKDYEGAKYYFRTDVELHPDDKDALTMLKETFKQLEEVDSSIFYYKKSLSRGIAGTNIYNALGTLFLESEKFDSAARWYSKAIAYDPANRVGYFNLGVVFEKLGQFDSAVVAFKKALKVDPDYYFANMELGTVYHSLRQYDSAIVYIRKAIIINPKNSLAYYYLALSYAMNNKPEEALTYLRQALERGYNSYEFIIIQPDLESIRKYKAYGDLMKKYFPKKYKPADEQ